MELQRKTHYVYRLMYQFVWIPKYRDKIFHVPYCVTMKAIIQKVGYDYDIDIVELKIPENRIHMVIRGSHQQSSSDVMQIIIEMNLPNKNRASANDGSAFKAFLRSIVAVSSVLFFKLSLASVKYSSADLSLQENKKRHPKDA